MSTSRQPSADTQRGSSDSSASLAAARWLQLLGRVSILSRRLRSELADCTRKCKVRDSDFLLLWHCHSAMPEGIDQSELAGRTAASPSQVSGRVEALRRANLLEAARDSADRRRQVWRITAAGTRVVSAVLAELEPLARRHAEPWGEEALQWFEHALPGGSEVPARSSKAADSPAVILLYPRDEKSDYGAENGRQRRAGGDV